MTKVILNIDKDIYLECDNHADDSIVCGMVSTLCNVATIEAIEHGYKTEQYEPGKVKLYLEYPSEEVKEVFKAVKLTFKEIAERYPDNVKLY